jgi:hypothetical protein
MKNADSIYQSKARLHECGKAKYYDWVYKLKWRESLSRMKKRGYQHKLL